MSMYLGCPTSSFVAFRFFRAGRSPVRPVSILICGMGTARSRLEGLCYVCEITTCTTRIGTLVLDILYREKRDFASGERRLLLLCLSGSKASQDFEPSMNNQGLAPLILDKESWCLSNLILSLMLILVIL